jgi:hypothetical protein
VVESLAALRRPLQEFCGAVDRDPLLVAGDQERDRALGPAAVCREIVERRGDLAGDRAFHVDGAAAVEHAVGNARLEWRMGPHALGAGRHHVGMAGEHEMRRARANARIEILDVRRARRAERHAMHDKAHPFQHAFEIGERATFDRRYRAAAHEIPGDGDGVGGVHQIGFISSGSGP